jgi:phage-related protein
MGMNLGTLMSKLGVDTKEFTSKMKAAEDKIDQVGRASEKVGKISGVAFLGMSAAIAGTTTLYGKQEEAGRRLATVARATGKALNVERMKAYAGELQDVTKFGDETTIAAMGTLAAFKLEENQIMKLIPAVQDFAEFSGQDLNQAAKTVGRAVTDSADMLKRYGISLSGSEQEAYKSMSTNERFSLVLEKLKTSIGGVARMMKGTASFAFVQLKNTLGDLGEEFGSIVDSPVSKMLDILKVHVKGLTKWFSSLDDSTKLLIAKLVIGATAFAGILTAVTGLAAILPSIIGGFKAFAAFGSLLTTGMLVPIIAIAAGIGGMTILVGAFKKAWVGDLGGIKTWTLKTWSVVADEFKDVLNWMGELWHGFSSSISETAIDLYGFIKGLSPDETFQLKGELASEWENIGEYLPEYAGIAADELKAGALTAGKDLVDTFKTGANAISSALGFSLPSFSLPSMSDIFGSGGGSGGGSGPGGGVGGGARSGAFDMASYKSGIIAKAGADIESEASDRLTKNLMSAAEGITSALGDAGRTIGESVMAFAAGDWQGALVGLGVNLLKRTESFEKISAMLENMFTILADVIEPLVGAVMNLLTPIMGLVTMIGEFLTPVIFVFEQAIQGVAWVLDKLARLIAKIFNGIAGVWNGIVGAISGILRKIGSFSIFGKKPFGFLEKWADSIDKSKINLIKFDDAVEDLQNESLNDFGDKIADISESLSNVPEGVKVALYRFNASNPETNYGSAGPNATTGSSGGQGTSIVVHEANFYETPDLPSIIDDIQREASWASQVIAGTSLPIGGGLSGAHAR